MSQFERDLRFVATMLLWGALIDILESDLLLAFVRGLTQ